MATKRTLNITQARKFLPRLAEDAHYYGTETIITRNDKPLARIVPYYQDSNNCVKWDVQECNGKIKMANPQLVDQDGGPSFFQSCAKCNRQGNKIVMGQDTRYWLCHHCADGGKIT